MVEILPEVVEAMIPVYKYGKFDTVEACIATLSIGT
jgi:hypothetical protein